MQTRQGQPLTQTKINNNEQEPELHPHDSCARVAPEDKVKHSQPQTRDKENVFSNLTDYVRNIEEKEPTKGIRGSGVRVAFEDSIRSYAEPDYQSQPQLQEQGGNVMENLTGFIKNIDENEPVKGIHGAGVRVAPEDSWKGRAQLPRVADAGSMSTNITGSTTNIDDNEPTEEVRRAGRGAPQETPTNQPTLNPVMQNLSGYIRNLDDDEPEKGIFGAGVRVNEGDGWNESSNNEEESVKRAHRAQTGPVEGTAFGPEDLTSKSDDSQMWRSTGRRVSNFEKTLGGYVTRQYYQEWHREKTDEPIKAPDGNCARIDPKDRLGLFVKSYATHGSS